MKNKIKTILKILFIIIVLGIVFYIVDSNRAKNNQKPLFCIKTGTLLDGGTIEYLGIGYKVIDFHTLAGFDDVKIGSWSMDYDDFRNEMKVYEERFEETLGSGVVVIKDGKINNETLIENFLNKASIDSSEEQTLIIQEHTSKDEYIEKKIKFVPGTYSKNTQEDGTITTNIDNMEELYGHYIFTINNDESTSQTFNYKWWPKRNTENGIVSLRFETSPLGFIDVAEFPVICSYSLESSNYTNKFELNYHQRKDKGLKTIIDHNTNTEYEYSVHTFGGDVDFTIENDMVYTLEKALEEKVVTVEDILNQAKMDAEYGICYRGDYSDGGSTEFMYEDYTILKYSTLDGLEDLVIGYKGQIINEVNKIIDK